VTRWVIDGANDQGWLDYGKGVIREANPYPSGDPRRAVWFAGWDLAKPGKRYLFFMADGQGVVVERTHARGQRI
tara:strand:+ start:394 stop:615 length:222 start_codon:yes stop_codon:yes gene_type:complete